MASRRGIALVIVLWAITVLAVVAASFTTVSRTEVLLARNLVENAKAEALADSAVSLAVMGLLEPDPDRKWVADGTQYVFALGEGEIAVAVQDEAGKIDLNAAPEPLLKNLFLSVGVADDEAQALASAVADFRDSNDLRRHNGAEDSDYRAAGLKHGAKDSAFELVEELQRVLGITSTLYRLVAPLVTVYSGRSGVDTQVAPPGVLMALLGSDEQQVEDLVGERSKMRVEKPGTRVPVPGLPRNFSTRSRGVAYSVRAEGRTKGGGLFIREAVISLTRNAKNPFRIHDWRQGRQLPVTTSLEEVPQAESGQNESGR